MKGKKRESQLSFGVCFYYFLSIIVFSARAVAPACERICPTPGEHCLWLPEPTQAVLSGICKLSEVTVLLQTEHPFMPGPHMM